MTTITIKRALLEQALEALELVTEDYDDSAVGLEIKAIQALRAALTAPDDVAEEMSVVADQYAHKLALDLECVLADYSGTWYDTAIGTLGAYREAMNAIHERQSPTFMGEPVIRPALVAPATAPEQCWCDEQGIGEPGVSCGDCPTRDYKTTAPEQPSWHDAPTAPGLWVCLQADGRSHIVMAVSRYASEHGSWADFGRWFGPIPDDMKKPSTA